MEGGQLETETEATSASAGSLIVTNLFIERSHGGFFATDGSEWIQIPPFSSWESRYRKGSDIGGDYLELGLWR